MSNIVAVLIVRCTHTGVYADGRPNTASVTIYDLDEVTIQKNRERAVPVPPNSFVDIPMSTRTFVSWHEGAICRFTKLGLITSEIILQLRDKSNCGGPAGTGQSLRPGVPNVERVGGTLRFVIPDNIIPTTLESLGFLVGEPVEVTGLTGAFRALNDEYVISAASPGTGLAGASAGSYLIEVPSAGADIPAATLAGVNICLTEGRVTAQFNSGGDVGGLGANVFGYIGGQLFPNAGGGGGGAPDNAEYVVLSLDPTLTDERVLTAGTGIAIVDGGANGPVTLSVDATLAEILDNGNATGGFNIVVSTGDAIVGQTDLVLDPGGGAGDNVIIDGLTWPSSDGALGDVLTTDGAGNLTFQAVPSAATGVLQWGNTNVGASTASRLLDPGFEDRLAPLLASGTGTRLRMPRAGTLRNLYVQHNTPGGTGATVTYTVRVNGVVTALAVSLASTATTASDMVSAVAVAAGDLVDIEVTKGAVIGTGILRPEVTLEVAA